MRTHLRAFADRVKPISLLSSLLELSGLAAIVYGVSTVYRPAAFIVGGLLAVAVALAVERQTP